MRKILQVSIAGWIAFSIACDNPTEPKRNPYEQHPIEWPSLADSPWPMYAHDPQNTNRSQYSGPDQGEIAWEYRLINGQTLHSNIVIGENDTIYFISSQDFDTSSQKYTAFIYKLDPDGNFVKKAVVYNGNRYPEIFNAPILTSTGKIWLASTDNYVYCLNRDLNVVFKKELNCEYANYLGGNINLAFQYIFPTTDSIYKFSENSDYCSVSISKIFSIAISPANEEKYSEHNIISYNNAGQYYFIDNNYLYAYGNENQLQWRIAPDPDSGISLDASSGQCIDIRGNIICCAERNWVFSISPIGKLNWRIQVPNFSPGTFPICDSDNNVYLGSNNVNNMCIICLDYRGNVKWCIDSFQSRYSGNMAINSRRNLLVLQKDLRGIICIK